MGELRLHIKQHLNVQQSTGLQGFYQGTSPANLTFVAGTLPAARQWSSYPNWRNVTDYADDITNLSIEFTQQYDNQGNAISDGGVGQKRTTTGNITLEGEAFFLIKSWLIDDISASLNIVEVMIEDVGCGRYTNYQITQNDLIYCTAANCSFELNIKQLDDPLSCIQRTIISDNWQGWFPKNGKPTNKQHPRFSYCNETKPNAILVALWYLMFIFGFALWIILTVIFAALIPILLAIYVLFLFIGGTSGSGGMIGILNLIPGVNIPALNPSAGDIWNLIQTMINAINGGILDGITNMFIESAGCGREHPAPLVQDYIKNVCQKCGVAIQAPIFFDVSITVLTSDPNRGSGGQITTENPYRHTCFYHPVKRRGIRRFKTLNLLNGFANPDIDTFWIEDNRPLLTLDGFLDIVCAWVNHEWMITNVNNSGQQVPTLTIYRKDDYKLAGAPLYDFSVNGADRNKIIQGICYEWNGRTLPAYTKGMYYEDATDSCGNEALQHYNGTPMIFHGNIDNNPNFSGELDKRMQLGAAKFRLDGQSNDYILDALQISVLANFILAPFILPIFNGIRNALNDYADYAILMQGEICTQPKMIIWDGGSYLNAKAIRIKVMTANNGTQPQINPYYNTTGGAYDQFHQPQTNVLGNFIAPQTYGAYTVQGLLTGAITRPAYLVNYPAFWDANYYDNLWDWFHWIDDPIRNVFMNQSFTVKIENCCDDLKRLGVFNNGGGVALKRKVKVDNKYQAGEITQITVSYKTDDIDGQFIEIKGRL